MRRVGSGLPLGSYKRASDGWFGASRSSERGASLVLVLMITTVIAIIAGAIMTDVDINVGATTTVTSKDNKDYAADAGVALGIQRLVLDPTACSDLGTTQSLTTPPMAIADMGVTEQVTVQCTNISGSSRGIAGYALVVTGPGGALSTSNGSEDRPVKGPLYNNGDWSGLGNNKAVDVQNASVVQSSGTGCLAPGTSLPPNLEMNGSSAAPNGPFTFCGGVSSMPDTPHALPDSVPPEATATKSCNGWTVYSPGKYDTTFPGGAGGTLTTATKSYFTSGVYYFENLNLSISGTAIAGQPGDDTESLGIPPPTGCDPAGTTGTGAEFILGGTSTITNSRQQFEIFTRTGGPATEGTEDISLLQVVAPASPQVLPPGWIASAPPGAADLLSATGNGVDMVVHGIVYAPTGSINFFAVNNANVKMMGGVKVKAVALDAPASISPGNFLISLQDNPGRRTVLIQSMAEGGAHDPTVSATAVVEFPNNQSSPVIDSWSTATF